MTDDAATGAGRLQGPVCVVAGIGGVIGGVIGEAVATRFADEGASVVGIDRHDVIEQLDHDASSPNSRMPGADRSAHHLDRRPVPAAPDPGVSWRAWRAQLARRSPATGRMRAA